MRPAPLATRCSSASLLGFLLAAALGWDWEQRLVIPLADGVVVYGQSSDDEEDEAQDEEAARPARRAAPPASGQSQRLSKVGELLAAEYTVRNFNGDRVSVRFEMRQGALKTYEDRFGYRQRDLDEMRAAYERERRSAYSQAVKAGRSQAQVDGLIAAIDKSYERRRVQYMNSRGFKVLDGNLVMADMPALVARDSALLQPIATALDRVSQQRKWGSEELIGSVTSLVQTGLQYRIPPNAEGDRRTGGVVPPAAALLRGWGDCDTKTGILASVLNNWPHMRMVGIGVPGHYLVGILRIPGKGDIFVEHEGLQYVLVEPAGPAWLPPGSAGEKTIALLESGRGVRIEPFF